jgi:hypothetical protein
VQRQVDGQWDIALRDLDMAVGLDADGNGELTWDEVRARHEAIAAYALARLKLASDGAACPLRVTSTCSTTQRRRLCRAAPAGHLRRRSPR